jgi:hypothetical protein
VREKVCPITYYSNMLQLRAKIKLKYAKSAELLNCTKYLGLLRLRSNNQTLFKQHITRLMVPALDLVIQVLTLVSAGKVHRTNVSVGKTPGNTHEPIQKRSFLSQIFIISQRTNKTG